MAKTQFFAVLLSLSTWRCNSMVCAPLYIQLTKTKFSESLTKNNYRVKSQSILVEDVLQKCRNASTHLLYRNSHASNSNVKYETVLVTTKHRELECYKSKYLGDEFYGCKQYSSINAE